MKYLFYIILTAVSVYSQSPSHFRIYADLQKEPFFKDVLLQTFLDDVFPLKFQMVVDTEPQRNAFIVIGSYNSPDVEWDLQAYRYTWTTLSAELRDMLLRYPKKILLK